MIPRHEWAAYVASKLGRTVEKLLLDYLADHSLLPTFPVGKEVAALPTDLVELAGGWKLTLRRGLLFDDAYRVGAAARLEASGIIVDLDESWNSAAPAGTYALLRNLARVAASTSRDSVSGAEHAFQRGPVQIRTVREDVARHIGMFDDAAQKVAKDEAVSFANSAYYMGSKQQLASFLVEGIACQLPPDGTVLDLMCGAGAAAKAFSSRWPTQGSDGLSFCSILTHCLGAGFTHAQALSILERVGPLFDQNRSLLETFVAPALEEEVEFGVSRMTDGIGARYAKFADAIPRYPEGGAFRSWDPNSYVSDCRRNERRWPYALFTAYYPCIYFGVRQCIEIDSIRFAIDNLADGDERSLAMAALVAACSALGSGYAGQFAQPLKISEKNVARVIDKRAMSIFQEFAVRIVALGAASERAPRQIRTNCGSWKDSLSAAADGFDASQSVLVYLDAPYTRDEYTRYYHVLETVVRYGYPSVSGNGRCPTRTENGYFGSSFFTRSTERFVREVGDVVQSILRNGWHCAWSHSSSGLARLPDLLSVLDPNCVGDIRSVAAPHHYKGQGRRASKRVTEYLTIFSPRDVAAVVL